MAKKQVTQVEVVDDGVKVVSEHDRRHDQYGREILDPVPMQPPLGYRKAPSIADQIRAQVVAHVRDMQDNEPETEEEADDFNVGMDEFDPSSPWENDLVPSFAELKKIAQDMNKQKAAALAAAAAEQAARDLAARSEPTRARSPDAGNTSPAPSEPALTPPRGPA